MSEYFVHASSFLDEGVVIGRGTKIWHFSHISRNAKIGDNCQLGQNIYVDANVTIGNGCKIQNNVSVYTGVTLEDGVFCGPSCVFTNVTTPRAFISRRAEFAPTLVKQGATIGANATIVCGHTLGEYCLIGAGSVVSKDVAPHALIVGVPGKVIGWVCECAEIIAKKNDLGIKTCHRCKQQYQVTADGVCKLPPLTNSFDNALGSKPKSFG